jgi:hypothetical protein
MAGFQLGRMATKQGITTDPFLDLDSFNGHDMTHPSLLNPFSPSHEPAKIFNRSKAGRVTPICSKCQSDDIISHATVQWSNESQEWELANTFAQPAHCNRCNSGCDLVWLPLN